MIAKIEEFKSTLSAIRERIATAKRRGTRSGYIDYHGCMWVCNDLNEILSETEDRTAKEEYELGYAISALVLLNCAKLASTADSSSGCLNDTIAYAQEQISKICAAVDKNSDAAKFIFEQGLKDAANKAFRGWEHDAYDFLASIAMLSLPHNVDKLYILLDEIDEKLSQNEYTSYHIASDKVVRLAAINAVHGEDAADKFISDNLNYDEMRRIAIRNAIDRENYPYAEKLCQERLEREGETRHFYSRPSEWRYLLFEIYDKADDTEKKIDTAEDLLFRFDSKYYAVLKNLLTEKGVWQTEYPALRLRLSQEMPYNIYLEILSKENEVQLLLEKVHEYPSSVFTYGKQLAKEYAAETFAICLEMIYKEAAEADNRTKYKKVCGKIKKLFEFGGTEEADIAIAELITKYPRRPAMLEELDSLEVKLAKKKI